MKIEPLALAAPFAPLVIVPLAMRAAAQPVRYALLTPAALLVAVSFFFEQGLLAAAFTLPWLAFTIANALPATRRILARGHHPLEEFAIHTGQVYLAIGGVWMVITRSGWRPLDFSNAIVLLTAIHFHYAGFSACVFAGLTGRALRTAADSAVYRAAAWSVLVGVPALAVGITLSRHLEVVTALLLAAGVVVMSALAMGASRGNLLISTAAAATVISMSMASFYAVSAYTGQDWLLIPQMAETHGIANTLGFALIGMLGWLRIGPKARYPEPRIPFQTIAGSGYVGPDFFDRTAAIDPGRHALGLWDAPPPSLPPLVRAFYTHTAQFRLEVSPHWVAWFVPGARLFRWFAERAGQLCLPLGAEENEVESRLVALRGDRRGWIRTHKRSGKPIYLASYSTYGDYMNIAFPLPRGNMTSILHVQPQGSVLRLGTTWKQNPGGDQGVYFVSRLFTLRLPFNETLSVWEENGTLRAKHDMWLWGIRYLTLDYLIHRQTTH